MPDELTATFWDVQHGSAAWLEMPNGDQIVFDLGSGSLSGPDAFSPLRWLYQHRRVRQLAAAIISHPHRDHIDDIANLDAVRPRALLRPRLTEDEVRGDNRPEDTSAVDAYLRFDRDYSGDFAPGESPLTARGDGVHFESFLPIRCPADNLNNRSVVSVVSYADGKLLLCGDNEPSSWLELLGQQRFRRAIGGTDVVLAPHHGRDSGFCPELFELITPKLTVISDGRFCDTSATARYKAVTSGWKTHYRRGGSERRFCLSTRRDGDIAITLGRNTGGGRFVHALAGQYP
jgi:beta-lactamase superfamily II metal-dependent hydrolase